MLIYLLLLPPVVSATASITLTSVAKSASKNFIYKALISARCTLSVPVLLLIRQFLEIKIIKLIFIGRYICALLKESVYNRELRAGGG